MIRRGFRQTGVRWCSKKTGEPSPSSSSSSSWVTTKSKEWEAAEQDRLIRDPEAVPLRTPEIEPKKKRDSLDDNKLKNRVDGKKIFSDPWAEAKKISNSDVELARKSTSDKKEAIDRRDGKKLKVDLPESPPENEVLQEVTDLTDDLQIREHDLTNISGAYSKENDWQYIITEDNFSMIEEEDTPWILDCWAPQCEDSIAMSVTLRLLVKAANDAAGKTVIKLGRMDCNTNYGLTLHLKVNSLPTALAIKGSELLEQQTGMVDEEGLAQFVFGFATTIYGEEILSDLSLDNPVCKLIDARISVKENEYQNALMSYADVYKTSMQKVEEERKVRSSNAEKNIFEPEATREITDAEILAGKSGAGMALVMFLMNKIRHSRKLVTRLPVELPKVFATMSDVRKSIATVEIMRLTGYTKDCDVEELEDEERIDQHNLDIKLKLIGAYFMSGDYSKTLSACFILIRKNRRHRDGAPKLVLCRVMQYIGRHHPIRDEYSSVLNELLKFSARRTSHISQKLNIALSEASVAGNPLAHEIPLMIDSSPFRVESLTRHPLLQ